MNLPAASVPNPHASGPRRDRGTSWWAGLSAAWLRAAACAATILPAVIAPQAAEAKETRSDWLDIELGKSIVLELPQLPRAISVTNPTVADYVQLGSPQRFQVQGKQIGTTDLVIQFPGDVPPMIYEITVHRDLSDLIRRVDSMIDGELPRIYPLNEHIVIEGVVSDLDTLERVALIMQAYDPSFVNLMTVSGDHQVQLEVVFAEVSRTQLRDMGVNLFWSPQGYGGQFGVGGFKGLLPGVDGVNADLAYNFDAIDFTLFGTIMNGINLLGAIEMLNSRGLAKLIAQPTLVSLSGQQAEFLAGGELPVGFPNAQGNVQIKFREFGTRMLFIPTVLSNDVIDIQIDLEMSAIDPSIGLTLNGVSVPGFTSRKVKSHVRLRSGMTFAIAGLLSEKVTSTHAEVPGLGRIPVLGAIFRKVTHRRDETELMVYVTPRLVRPLAPGELPPILGTTENNNPSDLALFLLGADRRAKSRTAAPTGDVGLQR